MHPKCQSPSVCEPPVRSSKREDWIWIDKVASKEKLSKMRSNYRCTSFDMDQTSAFISSLASPCNFNLKADKRSTSPRNCLWQLRLNWPLRFFRAREQMQAVPTKKEMRALTLAGLCLSSCGTATAGGCDSASCPPVGSSSLNVSMIAFSHGCADSSLELASVIRCYSWSIIETLEYLKAL